jgi:metal-sulfur cluster biosynthetic enzyme
MMKEADRQAVLAAAQRTRHEATHAGEATTDPRYRSDDPAVQRLWVALRDVMDPEIPISLVDLGLICAIRREGEVVDVDVTFTATACPCMEFIHQDIRERLEAEADVSEVRIRDVWDPPWTVDRLTAEGRAALKGFGVAA